MSAQDPSCPNVSALNLAQKQMQDFSKLSFRSAPASLAVPIVNLTPYRTFQPDTVVFAQSFLVLCPCPVKCAWEANFVMCEPEYSLNLLHRKHPFYLFFLKAYSIAFFFFSLFDTACFLPKPASARYESTTNRKLNRAALTTCQGSTIWEYWANTRTIGVF